MNHIAHSANKWGERHSLTDHSLAVASLAAEFSQPFGGQYVAYPTGLCHDIGKLDPEWKLRLIECEQGTRKRVGLDHKCAGMMLAGEKIPGLPGILVQFLIHGHHGGLVNPTTDIMPWLQHQRKLPGPKRALGIVKDAMPELLNWPEPTIPEYVRDDMLEMDLFLRLVFSALVDADSLDTEAHKLGYSGYRGPEIPSMASLLNLYESFLVSQSVSLNNSVNVVRHDVHEQCVVASSNPQGIFSLTVPTGGGKTRSALAFALHHAVQHRLRRIIVAVPFRSITQQTAGVYREIFGQNGVVLEHHSSSLDLHDDSRIDASENWDAPVVVTTNVQLFESLMANRRSKMRKLHNIPESVVVLDEVQALPPEMLSPILGVIRQLVEHYRVTVVLSTATQPTFEVIPEFRDAGAHEINTDNERHFKTLRRVDYEWRVDSPTDWDEIADWLRSEDSALAIVNTRRHAMELLDALGDPHCLHLSTYLCGAHRDKVLETVRERLKSGEPCKLVSTQVVEAGVDMDFPVVYRANAPLDAIIQAAGRCNRENRLAKGKVVVFQPPDNSLPSGLYGAGTDIAKAVRTMPEFDPDNPESIRLFYSIFLSTVVNPDKKGIQGLRKQLDFPEVAHRFQMIDDDNVDVVVEYPKDDIAKIQSLVEQFRNNKQNRPGIEIARELRPHTVSMRRSRAERTDSVEFVTNNLGVWHGKYDPVKGVDQT